MKTKGIFIDILITIKELGHMLPKPYETPHQHVTRLKKYNSGQLYNAIYQLKRKKLIEAHQEGLRLSKAGQKVLRGIIGFSSQRKDGLSTIVIFDIPEEKKKSRDYLRRLLKINGFRLLQRSVFEGQMKINKEFYEVLRELGITEHVTLIEGNVLA